MCRREWASGRGVVGGRALGRVTPAPRPPLGVTSPVTAVVASQEAGPLTRLLLRHVPPGERPCRPGRGQEAGPLTGLLLRHVPLGGHVAGHGGGSESGGRALGPVTPASRPPRREALSPGAGSGGRALGPVTPASHPPMGSPRPVTSSGVTSPSHGDPWSRRSRRSRRSRTATGPNLITAGTARFFHRSRRPQR
jgi:hypothetical protein